MNCFALVKFSDISDIVSIYNFHTFFNTTVHLAKFNTSQGLEN